MGLPVAGEPADDSVGNERGSAPVSSLIRTLDKLEIERNGVLVYSFGQVTHIESPGVYIVEDGGAALRVRVPTEPQEGEWIRFAGHTADNAVICAFADSLDGIDIALLKRGIEYLNSG